MIFSISLKLEGSGICMVMSLHHHINLVFIQQWCKLGTKYHTIGIRMIVAAAVYILMEYHNSPFDIFVLINCFFHDILMRCTVIIVCIKHDEQNISIAIIIIGSCLCFSLNIIGIGIGKSIRIVKMQAVLVGNAVMVTNGGCYRKKSQCLGSKISCILPLVASVIHLISCGYEKTNIGMIFECLIQHIVPVIAVISCCKILFWSRSYNISCILHLFILTAGLPFGSTDLRISDIQK